MYVVATMVKPILRILGNNPVRGLGQGFFQRLPGAGLGLAPLGFELASGLFDGRKIGRVRGQEPQASPAGLDQPGQPGDAVDAQIVQHDHIAGHQRRAGHVLEVGREAAPVQGPSRPMTAAKPPTARAPTTVTGVPTRSGAPWPTPRPPTPRP